MSVKNITVDHDNEGRRIDNFLFSNFKNIPKSKIYKVIRKGEVRVNSKRVKLNSFWINSNFSFSNNFVDFWFRYIFKIRKKEVIYPSSFIVMIYGYIFDRHKLYIYDKHNNYSLCWIVQHNRDRKILILLSALHPELFRKQ